MCAYVNAYWPVLCLMAPLRLQAAGLSDRWTGRACGLSKISLYLSTFGNDRDCDAQCSAPLAPHGRLASANFGQHGISPNTLLCLLPCGTSQSLNEN